MSIGAATARLGRRRGPAPAGTDATTGLPDRSALAEWARSAIERSNAHSKRAVVAFVDVGLLRDVNDAFGVDTGDRLLRAAGERLASIDLPRTRVARHAGAEFAIVFEGIDSIEMAGTVGQFLIELLSPGFSFGRGELMISPSAGLAVSSDRRTSPEALVAEAHRALVRAREQGGGCWEVHDDTARDRSEARIDEARLAAAIENREFALAFQPIVRLDTGLTIGFEALIRWQAASTTTNGVLSPRDFMPLLDKTGMSVRVGRWVVEEACRQAAAWNQRFPDRPTLVITCNVGPRQLARTDFVTSVEQALHMSGVPPWQVCLDITEAALRHNRSSAWTTLRQLKDRGVKLALDDFGTGVSSLTYLREFKLDILRVDRTFVENVHRSREDQAIIRHVAGLAHDLGIAVVAEGVELPEQAEVLRAESVDLAQGFHFGRPAFAPDATARLGPARGFPVRPTDTASFTRGGW